MSDETRDRATYRARLAEKDREIQLLKNRLKAIADCQCRRCSLCLDCMDAAGVTIRGYGVKTA